MKLMFVFLVMQYIIWMKPHKEKTCTIKVNVKIKIPWKTNEIGGYQTC